MGSRSGGDATSKTLESRNAVFTDGDRRVFQVRLKSKTVKAVTAAFESNFRRSGGCRPRRLQTDKGKEFYNATFAKMLDRYGIRHFSTQGDAKASVVERFNWTLKGRMYQYFTAQGTQDYVSVLPALVEGYNKSLHRSIGMAPKDVTERNEQQVWQRLDGKKVWGRARPHLKVGQKARLSQKHHPLKKVFLPGWAEEVFIVNRMVPGPVTTSQVTEWDGTPMEGQFYEEDLPPVLVPEDTLFHVEKILQ